MASLTSIARTSCAVGWLLVCVVGSGCAAGGGGTGGDQADIPAGVGQGGAGTDPAGNGGAGRSSDPGGDRGSGSALGADAPVSAASSSVPCDVASIVSQHCVTCHAETPQFNAPMSLTSAADFGALAPISGAQPVREVAARRIRAEGGARMPPPGTVEALAPAEIDTLAAWLESGAPGDADGCSIGAAAESSGDTTELLPRPTATGTLLGPYETWDADGVECYPFLTYEPGGSDKSTPYRVGAAVDRYVGFGFRPPWQGTRYVRAFRSCTTGSCSRSRAPRTVRSPRSSARTRVDR